MTMDSNINIVEDLLFGFQKGHISKEYLLDQLILQFNNVLHLNSYEESKRERCFAVLAGLEVDPDPKYKQLYMSLTLLHDLWAVRGNYDFTLLQMMCYNGNSAYCDILCELTNYSDLWKIRHPHGKNTALHMLISTCKNYHKEIFEVVLKKLVVYPELWLISNDNGMTPMHEMCQYRNDIVFDILDSFTDYMSITLWEKRDLNLMTPLHHLCIHKPNDDNRGKYLDVLKKLAEFENLWTMKDKFMYTPLHFLMKNFVGDVYESLYNRLGSNPEAWMILRSRNGGEGVMGVTH